MTKDDVLKELEQLLSSGASAHVVFGLVAAFVETNVHRDLVDELKQQSQSLDHYAARIEKLEKKLRYYVADASALKIRRLVRLKLVSRRRKCFGGECNRRANDNTYNGSSTCYPR